MSDGEEARMAPCDKHYLTNCADCSSPVRRRKVATARDDAWSTDEALTAVALRDEGRTYAEIGEVLGRTANAAAAFFARLENRSGAAEATRRAQAATLRQATANGQPWDASEDDLLLEDNGMTVREKALTLGRTLAAATNRLSRLREGRA